MANDSNDPLVLPPTIWIALIGALAGAFVFAPFSAQPFVRAVLIPLLTYGATAVLGYPHIGS